MANLALALLLVVTGPSALDVREIDYRGWPDAVLLTNGEVEVVIVPAIGRLMRFAYRWDDNPLWENPALYGQLQPDLVTRWFNFGGDKIWPAEQSRWPQLIGRGWPPDTAFDGRPQRAEILGDGAVRLTTAVSEALGLRGIRTFRLDRRRARLVIEQKLQTVAGDPVPCTIWNVTQLDHPDAVYLPLRADSTFPGGYAVLSEPARTPRNRVVRDGVLTITRDRALNAKYGADSDGGWLAWTRGETVFSEHFAYQPGAKYPDRGCTAEVYTSADEGGEYIELELLSPEATLAVGESLDYTIELRLGRIGRGLGAQQHLDAVRALMR